MVVPGIGPIVVHATQNATFKNRYLTWQKSPLRRFHITLKSGLNPDSTISHLIWINCNMYSIRLQVNPLAEVNWLDSIRIHSISKMALALGGGPFISGLRISYNPRNTCNGSRLECQSYLCINCTLGWAQCPGKAGWCFKKQDYIWKYSASMSEQGYNYDFKQRHTKIINLTVKYCMVCTCLWEISLY